MFRDFANHPEVATIAAMKSGLKVVPPSRCRLQPRVATIAAMKSGLKDIVSYPM